MKEVINNLTGTVHSTNDEVQPWKIGVGITTLVIVIFCSDNVYSKVLQEEERSTAFVSGIDSTCY